MVRPRANSWDDYVAVDSSLRDVERARRRSEQPSRTCIASRSSIVIFSVVCSPPSHPSISPRSPPTIPFSRYLSFSPLSLFSRVLALTPSLPVTGAPASLFLSLPLLSLSYPLYTRECTLQARFKDRHASTFSYTNVHLGGPAGTTDTTPRRLHHPSSSSARRVSQSSPLSFSLPLAPSDSLLLSILCALARRCTRPCCAAVVSRRRERDRGDGRRENLRNVKSRSVS